MRYIAKLLSLQFAKFIIIGAFNTFNGVGLALLYGMLFRDNVAFVMGYLTSLTIAYLLNSMFTFHERLYLEKYVRFCISYIPNFIIQNTIVFIFLNILNWNKIVVYGMAAVIGLPITFLLTKYFAFKQK